MAATLSPDLRQHAVYLFLFIERQLAFFELPYNGFQSGHRLFKLYCSHHMLHLLKMNAIITGHLLFSNRMVRDNLLDGTA